MYLVMSSPLVAETIVSHLFRRDHVATVSVQKPCPRRSGPESAEEGVLSQASQSEGQLIPIAIHRFGS